MSARPEYPQTPLTRPTRRPERFSYDKHRIHRLVDEALVSHLAFEVDHRPVVLPMTHVRIGDDVYLHGSPGAGPFRGLERAPANVCLTVTVLDGIVLGRRYFTHSVNFRSVVVHGELGAVTGTEEKLRVLDALLEHIAPGRARDCEPPSRRELAATGIHRLSLAQSSFKERTGMPIEKDTGDTDGTEPAGAWSGVVPVNLAFGPPQSTDPAPPPDYVTGYARPHPGAARAHA
ncbi:pyridoxamine 5'-phosphate oxidase family protein [Amycolatopsis jejuensis]|uniref:pyridoxamine 5'-phosphate oxidase family protein n=1 Tax=Amycolatopsis jejuensis TaxID=330084 RepID=UPI00068C9E0E|nr:pyridoxamine 5'-phosphate oxidase family protein [Amycolatopsis jejuensis]